MRRNWKIAAVFAIFAFVVSLCSCDFFSNDDGTTEEASAANSKDTSEESTTTSAETEKIDLREFSVSILIDGEKLNEDFILEGEDTRLLSFVYSDSETGATQGLPDVTAKWEFVSGSIYAGLKDSEGNEVQISNTNYSDSIQPLELRLTITPAGKAYKVANTIVELNAAVLARKDIGAVFLCDGNELADELVLGSATDALLSYKINASIGVSASWQIVTGDNYIAKDETEDSVTISNINCSGETQNVTVKITITPKDWSYNTVSRSVTFIAEDSSDDLRTGAFSASAALGADANGNYDGTVRISWTESKNAQIYCVYRNKTQIAYITTGDLEYIDKDCGSASSLAYGRTQFSYYVQAINLIFTSNTDTVDVDIAELLPPAPTNVAAYLKKDSGGYTYVDISWQTEGNQECDVYRLVTNVLGVLGANIAEQGTLIETTSSNKLTNGDYAFLNEITESNCYVMYIVVAKRTWASTGVTVNSVPVRYYFDATSLLEEKTKQGAETGTELSYPSPAGSNKSGSLSLSASKGIVYNRYSYCKLNFSTVSGVKNYKIYRGVFGSNSMKVAFGKLPDKSDCTYIGSTTYNSYVDTDICNQYFWENSSSSGKYYMYVYYYVEAEDSSGRTYVSAVVKAE